MFVKNALYVNGVRASDPMSLEQTFEHMRASGGMAWIGLYRPGYEELKQLADEFNLHELALEDAVEAHQRPKIDRYGTTLFTVLRPARYIDAKEEVEFGEVHIFTGPDFVITVRHAETPNLGEVRKKLERKPERLALGPEAVLYAIIDQVVDEYGPVIAGLENDIDEIENQLFKGDPDVSRRIFDLSREVIEFQRATKPLEEVFAAIVEGFEKYHVDIDLQQRLIDSRDHCMRVIDRVDSFRQVLQNALMVQSTLVTQRQNDEMKTLAESSNAQNEEVKKISAWAAIGFAPTLVGTVYGMNFKVMPELGLRYGYAMALGLMAASSGSLYWIFKKRGWL
jgi:magnesium transporter